MIKQDELAEKAALGAQVLKKVGMLKQNDLVDEFNKHVNEKSYLIVLNDLSNIEELDYIRTYFPNNKKGSRIIVSTRQAETARLCAEQDCAVLELKQSLVDQDMFAFCKKDSQSRTNLTEPELTQMKLESTMTTLQLPVMKLQGIDL